MPKHNATLILSFFAEDDAPRGEKRKRDVDDEGDDDDD